MWRWLVCLLAMCGGPCGGAFSAQMSYAGHSLADKVGRWRWARAGQCVDHVRRCHHLRILAMQIGQRHRMHLVRRSWRARIIDLSKRKATWAEWQAHLAPAWGNSAALITAGARI